MLALLGQARLCKREGGHCYANAGADTLMNMMVGTDCVASRSVMVDRKVIIMLVRVVAFQRNCRILMRLWLVGGMSLYRQKSQVCAPSFINFNKLTALQLVIFILL